MQPEANFCPIERPTIPNPGLIEPKKGIIPQSSRIPPPLLHQWILDAKNKQQIIEALARFASSYGGLSGAPPEVWSKVRG